MITNHNIDVLPLAAIGLILVILMVIMAPMVTTHANTEVEVPSAHTEERQVEEDIAITLTKEGRLYFNDAEIARDPLVLIEHLKAEYAKDPYKLTIVRADKDVLHADVLELLAACRTAAAPLPPRLACATRQDTTRAYKE